MKDISELTHLMHMKRKMEKDRLHLMEMMEQHEKTREETDRLKAAVAEFNQNR